MNKNWSVNIFSKKLNHLVIFFILALISFKKTFIIVNPGTVKVVTRLGYVTGRVLEPGPHFISPFIENVLTYNTKKVIYETTSYEKQQISGADYKDYPVDTNTKDGQQVDIYYTVRFSIDPTKVTWIAQNLGSEMAVVEKIVKAESRVWIRNIVREYEAEQLYTGNIQEVQYKIESKLRHTFNKNGVILDAVGIREIKFTPQYVNAIEQKQIEAVRVETEKYRADQAKYEKERRITQAEGMAKEQELQRTTLTDQLLKKMWVEKWDGRLPTYYGGGNAIPFFDIAR